MQSAEKRMLNVKMFHSWGEAPFPSAFSVSPNMVIWGTFPSKYSFRFFVVTQNRNRCCCCWREGEENEKFLRWYAVHYTAFETFWALWVSFSFRVFFRGFFLFFFSPVGVSGGKTMRLRRHSNFFCTQLTIKILCCLPEKSNNKRKSKSGDDTGLMVTWRVT